jgi:hypothetical protein
LLARAAFHGPPGAIQGHGRAVDREGVSQLAVEVEDGADGLVLLALFYGLEGLGAEMKAIGELGTQGLDVCGESPFW